MRQRRVESYQMESHRFCTGAKLFAPYPRWLPSVLRMRLWCVKQRTTVRPRATSCGLWITTWKSAKLDGLKGYLMASKYRPAGDGAINYPGTNSILEFGSWRCIQGDLFIKYRAQFFLQHGREHAVITAGVWSSRLEKRLQGPQWFGPRCGATFDIYTYISLYIYIYVYFFTVV